MGWDAAGDVEGAFRCEGDRELEEFIYSSLLCWSGVSEVGLGVVGQLVECFELCRRCPAALLPEVELPEVAFEGCPFVGDLVEGGGELLIVDVASGVGADHSGFFEVQLVEASGD